MKITVYRQLAGGIYNVSFKVGEFSQEEVGKMQSFGVPSMPVKDGVFPQQITHMLPLTQVTERFKAGFKTEQEAKAYETEFLERARKFIEELRARKDEFTSTNEVAL
jgi:hypothetical protein